MNTPPWSEPHATAVLVLADGTVIEGMGWARSARRPAKCVFNTAMTGYQEILTDPSYAGQIITFTFPHIGMSAQRGRHRDRERGSGFRRRGCVLKTDISDPANWRATRGFGEWLRARGMVGIAGVDTRAA
jgi:carbamoyl-phosphate synthase small subunit